MTAEVKPAANKVVKKHTKHESKKNEEPTVVSAVAKSGAKLVRPDRVAFDNEVERLNKDIEVIKGKLDGVKAKIEGKISGGSKPGDKRKELRDQLESIKQEQSAHQTQRQVVLNQLKKVQESMKKKTEDLKSLREKTPFKSVVEIDRRIGELEALVSSGSLKLIDEKRVLSDMSNLRKQRKQFDTFGPQELAIDNDKRALDEIKKKLDAFEPENTRLKKAFGSTLNELKSLDSERNETQSAMKGLFSEREKLSKDLNALHQKRRDLHSAFYAARDEWSAFQKADRARKAELMRKEREEFERQKRLEKVRVARENAEIPAFEAEISSCNALLNMLRGTTAESDEVETAADANEKIRKPSESENLPKGVSGAVMLKKKSDRIEDDEIYFVGKKKSKSKKPVAEKEKDIKFDLSVMERFWKLKLEAPTKQAEVSSAIESVEAKKKYFLDNQDRVTKENIQKAKELEEKLLKEEAERVNKAHVEAAAQSETDKVDAEEKKEEEEKVDVVKEVEAEAEQNGH